MRKYFIFSLSFFLSSTIFSQIPNGSFENWNSMGTYMNPLGWGTMNNTTASTGVFTVNRGSNPDSTRFMKIASRTVGSSVVRGVAVSGILDSITLKPKSGFAFNSQPDSLVGIWSHMGHGGDPGMISVALTRWNNIMGKRDTVAFGCDTTGVMAMTFIPFGVKLNYMDVVNPPDSCIIYIAASGNLAMNYDYINIDSLSFAGNITSIPNHSSSMNKFSFYPNPSTSNLSIALNLKYARKVSIQLTTLEGKLLKEKTIGTAVQGENILNFDVSEFSEGNYFLRIISSEGVETKKVIIE
jgi:hypothetical protein